MPNGVSNSASNNAITPKLTEQAGGPGLQRLGSTAVEGRTLGAKNANARSTLGGSSLGSETFDARPQNGIRQFQAVTGAAAMNYNALGATERPELMLGSRGAQVLEFQRKLGQAGADVGGADGVFGAGTARGTKTYQAAMGLEITGQANAETWAALDANKTIKAVAHPDAPNVSEKAPYGQYRPNSVESKALFKGAAEAAGVPENWSESASLHKILEKESRGRVGVPNYTYGKRARDPEKWAGIRAELMTGTKSEKSSATGLGQMTLPNVEADYPQGKAGIGDPYNEAVGMLKYIKRRYGTPEKALAFHEKKGWY